MSLIHQVLNDLDERRDMRHGEIIGYADNDEGTRLMIWPALVISVLAAVLVLYFSHYFDTDAMTVNRGAIPIIPVSGSNPAIVPVIAEVTEPEMSELSDIRSSEILAPKEEVPAAEAVIIDVPVKPAPAEDNHLLAEVEPATLEKPEALPAPASIKTDHASVTDAVSGPQDVPRTQVVRRTDPETYYIRAVTYYRNGDWQRALSQLEEATAMGAAIEYPALQARIYSEQGMRDEFITLYNRYSANQSKVWLSTIAPGLHMFARYEDAVTHYSELMRIEPGNTKWAIARTQAQIDAGALSDAKRSLQFLSENYQLSVPQKAWVDYQSDMLE